MAVLALLIYRQLRTRPVNAYGLKVIAVLAVVGVVETSEFLQKNHGGAVTYAAIGGSLVLAAIFGALRAATVRIWRQDGQPWSKGSWLTASLWIVALAAHLGYDALVAHGHAERGLGAATVVLYLADSSASSASSCKAGRTGCRPAAPPRRSRSGCSAERIQPSGYSRADVGRALSVRAPLVRGISIPVLVVAIPITLSLAPLAGAGQT